MADCDLVVIGSGPGGYVAAIRAAQLGMKTAVVERGEIGGVCLNWGCIPTKALLRNAELLSLLRRADEFGISFENLRADYGKAVDRSRQAVQRLTRGVASLLRKNKVEVIQGHASFLGAGLVQAGERRVSASNVIIATGARARTLPSLPVDGKLVLTYREALEQREVPSSVVIVGGGAVGVEFAYIYNSYGAQVTILEMLPRLLPQEDAEISQQLERSFASQGIKSMTGARVEALRAQEGKATVKVDTQEGAREVEGERVLVAVGIQGNVEELGLEKIGVQPKGGFIPVDESLSVGVDGVFAIGDVTGKLPLAHVASAQGVYVVERLAGREAVPPDYTYMPRAVYCQPQVASIGLTEEQAKERGLDYKVGKFPFRANGKAVAMGESEGMVKVVVDDRLGEVLGAHMIGHEVTELLPELSLARLLEGTDQELGWLVHSHPTLSEAVKEAALAARGQAIHI